MNYLIHFDDDAGLDAELVGHKFASLARAHRAGLPVPSAVAISVEVHRFYRANGQWPDGVLESVFQAAARLELAQGLSVRSSATLEDLPNRSFAGQYSTFLNVCDEIELQQKIEACWNSSEHIPTSYFQVDEQQGMKAGSRSMAVILQKMVQAAAAGVAFSRNPMFPGRREVVIECIEGLGDKLVSSHVTPYRGHVREGREVSVEPPSSMHSPHKAPLKQNQWREIASLAYRLEEFFSGLPQDIEWAVDRTGKLWLLQSRPITTIREVDAAAPEGVWTRRIADDLWADRLTPFLADAMLRNSPRLDLSRYSRILGIPVIRPTLTIINGFLYVNCDALQQALALIPRGARTVDLRRLFPPGYEKDIGSPSLAKMVSFLFRFSALTLFNPVTNPLLSHRITLTVLEKLRKRLQTIQGRKANGNSRQTLQNLHDALELMAALQETNQWPYSYATIFTWLLRWLIVDQAGKTYRDFLRALGKGADNITLEIESELRRITEIIRRDDGIRKSFCSVSPEARTKDLPVFIERELADFIDKYGTRSQHRTLLVKRWTEAPEQVFGMLAQLAKTAEDATKPVNPESRRSFPQTSNLVDWLLSPVQHLARNYLDLREELRFFLDEILYLIRRLLLDLGTTTGLGEDTMFLTEQELADLILGKESLSTMQGIADERRKAFQQQQEPYTYYVDGRPINELASKKGILEGIGTSSGKASGYARIVEDPGTSSLNRGDILVAKNTDPGWTPILSIVAGVVTEEGGLLNHCSIVARELGIPAVVGLREATRQIPEGAYVTVDGDLGIVAIASNP